MHIRIISSCTGEKATSSPNQLTMADFRAGPTAVEKKHRLLAASMRPAEDMYTGQQQLRLQRGRQRFLGRARDAARINRADLWLLSAGYGLLKSTKPIAPYECTFKALTEAQTVRWAVQLGVPQAIRQVLAAPYDLGLILLGKRYLLACALDADVRLGGPTLLFTSASLLKHIPELPGLRMVVLDKNDSTRFHCAQVGLKGELGGRVLSLLAATPEALPRLLDPGRNVLDELVRVPPV